MADDQKKLNQGGEQPKKKTESSNSSNKKKRRRKPRTDIDATKKVTGSQLAEFKDSLPGEIKQNTDINKQKNDNGEHLTVPKKKKRRRRKKKPKAPDSVTGESKPAVPAEDKKENGPKSPELIYQYTQPEQKSEEESIQVFPLAENSDSNQTESKQEVDSSVPEPEELPVDEESEVPDEPEQTEQPVAPDEPEPSESSKKTEESNINNDEQKIDRLGPEDIQVAPHGTDLYQQQSDLPPTNDLEQAYDGSNESNEPEESEQESWVDLMKRHQEADQQSSPLEKSDADEVKDENIEQPEVRVGPESSEVADVRVDEKPKELDEKDSDAASKVEFKGQVEEEKYPSDINFIGEKNSILDVLKRVGNTVLKVLGSVFNFKVIFGLLIVALLAGGGYFFLGGDIWSNFDGWFGGGEADNGINISDEGLYEENGFLGASIFGENQGSMKDLIPVQVGIADFFGRLREPREQGETGISAATYYGELMDEREIVNMFVSYVDTLERMQNLYQVDVYELLDKTTDREEALRNYLIDLRDALEEGRISLDAIELNIDDLSQSFNSLSPDKQQYEDDFFASLEDLEAEKSDVLLKSFVDASQKQVALKARVAALERLKEYYDNALAKVERRISAIDQNMEALSRGIRVVDVPGAGIDLIVREQ